MTDPLSLDRFRALADAYGGIVARWPENCRDAALPIAGTAEGAAILEDASALDARLDAWTIRAPSADLASRIATRAKRAGTGVRPRPALWWWSGIGIAASLAGAAAGAASVAMIAPAEIPGSTSFGDVAGTEG